MNAPTASLQSGIPQGCHNLISQTWGNDPVAMAMIHSFWGHWMSPERMAQRDAERDDEDSRDIHASMLAECHDELSGRFPA